MKKAVLTKDQVKHVAKLANLELTEKEVEKFGEQLSHILEYVGQLDKVKTTGVEPIAQITGLENVSQKDEDVVLPLSQEEALHNAPTTYNGFFKVKAIFENREN